MERITNREQFIAFAKRMKVRYDWHEPDEQDLTAKVEGVHFDNTGAWPQAIAGPRISKERVEINVTFSQDGYPIAAVNLADLCAWATAPTESAIIEDLRQQLDEANSALDNIQLIIKKRSD